MILIVGSGCSGAFPFLASSMDRNWRGFSTSFSKASAQFSIFLNDFQLALPNVFYNQAIAALSAGSNQFIQFQLDGCYPVF
jgi:hypothetical protein